MIIIGFAGKARYGKTTAADAIKPWLIEQGYKVDIQPLAKIMKEQAMNVGWDGKKDEKGRRLLQEISWPVKHYHGEHIYAKWALEAAENKDLDIMLIDDVRMMAEVNYYTECKANGRIEDFILVRIERPNFVSDLTPEQLADCSETQLDNYHFDNVIQNDGTIEELAEKIKPIIKTVLK